MPYSSAFSWKSPNSSYSTRGTSRRLPGRDPIGPSEDARLPCATMRALRLSPVQYRRVTVVAAMLLAAIIVTGGAVRLTGSGLGCPDWPNCEPGRLTPYTANDFHAMVEFVNRTVTGLVSVAVIVAVLGSLVRAPRR